MNDLSNLKYKILGCIITISCLCVCNEGYAQKVAIKTNALGWATASFNAGVEGRLGDKFTGECSVYYNPFTFKNNKKVSGLAVQPEARYWFCMPFYKHFLGLHAMYSDYNVGWDKYRYQGNLFGGGISYGYQMIIARRWNLEFNIGVGYARMNHDKYLQPKCGYLVGHRHDDYVGITKLGISFIYILK